MGNWLVGRNDGRGNRHAAGSSNNVNLRGGSAEAPRNSYSFPEGTNVYKFSVGRTDASRHSTGLVSDLFNFAGAALLLVLLAPVFLLIAVAIRLDSRGPIFFRQERHGRRGRLFHIYKFRTMHVLESSRAAVQCRKDDPRVTRVGALLRKRSLDELPQLINVLRGEMALVGPRPHAISTDREFAPRIRRYGQRYTVKPGMTGLAQICGYRGPTATLADMAARVTSDLEYVRRRSMAFDLWILFKTVPALFGGRNAF